MARRFGHRATLLGVVVAGLLFPASALAVTTITFPAADGDITGAMPPFTYTSDDGTVFECSLDGGDFEACPSSGFTPAVALPDGIHTFEVRDPDATNPTTDSRTFIVDTGPPDTMLSGPSGLINDSTPEFNFSSTESDSTLECRLDAGYAPCSSPYTPIAPLPDGVYTFNVRAVDAASNQDPESAERTFTVDTIAPGTSVDSGPVGTVPDRTPTFTFSAPDQHATTFECRVGGGAFGPCSGPGQTHTPPALADGSYAFQVRATDAAGNSSIATWLFKVDTSGPPDTTPPDTTVTKKPKSRIKTKKKKAGIEVAFSSEPGAAFRCKLDKAKYEPCTSPYSVKARSKPGKGKKHAISVRAIDSAGNVGEPVVVGFRVVRKLRLKESVAERTVVTALQRHGFAKRVVKAVHADCSRRAYSAFSCKFSGSFPGYRLKGRGEVELRAHLSYRFRVKAQGVRLTLTDRNESG